MTDAPAWHALLAPLPDDALPRRQPVGSPEVLATPEGAAIAGWEQLTVDLSAGAAGLRNVLVVLDGSGRPISANDTVLYHRPGAGGQATFHHESLGGRFEADGSFRGTRWTAVSVDSEEAEDLQTKSVPREPDPAEVAALRALVDEVLRRAARLR
jgi:hypothetical protein